MQGKLILKDKTVMEGESFGAEISTSGEVVFNTGMTGYPESLTDPSYFGQIMVLTYPLIGNFGVPEQKWHESKKIWVKGLIVQNYINNPSHFESLETLGSWLKREKIPAIYGVDTRALTRKLREHGVMLGHLEVGVRNTKKVGQEAYDPNLENVLSYVSVQKPETYGAGKKHIVLIDCGAKENILRSFLKRGMKVTVVPWNFDPIKNKLDFDGLMISNGPGDPKKGVETIKIIKRAMDENVPTFGICLGSQLLALASGADTYKLKFGHRGHNQPVLDVETKKAYVTSQNHGFAVDTKTLKPNWVEWFINLNDGSNEGIRHKNKPFLSVQFHPEASPGPIDADYLFDEFIAML